MSRAVSHAVLGLVALLGLTLAASSSHAAEELVRNGFFTLGADGKPAGWQTAAYNAGSATSFAWGVDSLGTGALTIANTKPNDASWSQNVGVSPSTWYRISGWVKTENVGEQRMGAYLSVLSTFDNSRDIRGTTDWQPVVLWVRTGPIETSLQVACRLGGYSAENSGTAYFTGISVTAAGTPLAGTQYVYGGSADSDSSGQIPWAKGAAVLVAVGAGFIVWRYLIPARAQG